MPRPGGRACSFRRTKALTPEQTAALRQERAQGVTLTTLMHRYGIGKMALYRYLAPDQAEAEAGADLYGTLNGGNPFRRSSMRRSKSSSLASKAFRHT